MQTDAGYRDAEEKSWREAEEKELESRSRQEMNRIVDEKIRDEQFYREVDQLQHFLRGQP